MSVSHSVLAFLDYGSCEHRASTKASPSLAYMPNAEYLEQIDVRVSQIHIYLIPLANYFASLCLPLISSTASFCGTFALRNILQESAATYASV